MNESKAPINIVLLCLDSSFCKDVAADLASKLGMFFSDCKDLVEYELLDSKAIIENCGFEYLKKRESEAIKHALVFENTVLSCDFDLFKNYRKLFNKKSLICYLQLPEKCISKKETINLLSFKTHDEYLKNNCDIVVVLKSLSKNMALKRIIESMREKL